MIIVTAGQRHGTPDWQLNLMVESEAASIWEQQQKREEPKMISRYSFEAINKSWAALETARHTFEMLESEIAEALESVNGTPQSDKLASIYDSISDLALEVKKLKDELKVEAHRAWTEGRIAK